MRFLTSAKAFRLKINLKKTEVMYQPPLGFHDIGQDIQIKSQVYIIGKQVQISRLYDHQ